MSGGEQSHKPWYKRWWGILIVFCIWPYFLTWWVWRKAKWQKSWRVAVPALLAVCCRGWFVLYLGMAAAPFTSQPTAQTSAPGAASSANHAMATVTTADITITQPIPFTTTTQDDSSLPKGQTKVGQAGQNGVSTLTYEMSYTNGKETSRTLLATVTSTPPVNEVDDIGTYVPPLLDISGSGTKQTQKFTASGDWTISYTFDCSNFGMQGNFQIYIYNDDGTLSSDVGPNDLAMRGGTTDYYYDDGTHYLDINSECSWHVTATDSSTT